jgi:hypothetical protein
MASEPALKSKNEEGSWQQAGPLEEMMARRRDDMFNWV